MSVVMEWHPCTRGEGERREEREGVGEGRGEGRREGRVPLRILCKSVRAHETFQFVTRRSDCCGGRESDTGAVYPMG